MTIICTAPEIWTATNRIFCHFGSFFALLPLATPPTPTPPIPFLTAQKIKMLKKMKKKPGDIIILPKCTKNHDHMLHCSSDTARDGCNFYFSFCTIFAFLPPPNDPKNQDFLKMKKNPWRYHHFTRVPKIMIICYTVLKYGVWQM